MRIIGITGTLGAGKGTIVDYLTKNYEAKHYSVRAYITSALTAAERPVNRDTLVDMGNELRKDDSAAIIKALAQQAAHDAAEISIIESIRTTGEIKYLRETYGPSFVLFAVDGDQELRYTRISERGSATDGVSFDIFAQQEARESVSNDPAKQNLRACKELADYTFTNNGTFEELHAQVDPVMTRITN